MEREYRTFTQYGALQSKGMPGPCNGMPCGEMPAKGKGYTPAPEYRRPFNGMQKTNEMTLQRQSADMCDCPCSTDCLCQSTQPYVPSMAYVPDLDFSQILPLETAFCVGTIFTCLHLPFTGKECN